MSAQWGFTIPVTVFMLGACSVYDSSLLATNPIVASAGAGAGGTAGEGASAASGAGTGAMTSNAGAETDDAGAGGLPSELGGSGGMLTTGGSGGGASAGAGGAQAGGGSGGVSGGGASGHGGDGGSAGKVVLALENIDTMEDNNGAIEAPRNGDWYAGHDDTATGTQTPGATFVMTALPITDARYNASTDKYAAMTKGVGFNVWGEDMGFNIMLVDPSTHMHPQYDASAYCGIHFYGRVGVGANNTVVVRVPDKNSLPDGGQCTTTTSDKPCYQYFQKVYSFNTTWTEYNVLFSQLKGTGWPTALDLNAIYSIEFGLAASSTFELWIDDASFLKKPVSGVCPVSYP